MFEEESKAPKDQAPEKNAWLPRAGWLLLAIAPPASIGLGWRQFALEHPIIALIFVGVYWIILWVSKFGSEVASDLRGRYRSKISSSLGQSIDRRISRFGQNYKEYILTSVRYIDQKGIPIVGSRTPELDEVYVDLSLAPRPPHQVSSGLLSEIPPEITERRSLQEFLNQLPAKVLVVTGSPGSGKTTLIRHTAKAVIGKGRKRRRIPVILYLREHASILAYVPERGLPSIMKEALGDLKALEPEGWFEQQLTSGNCVVLFDGLDEVASDEARKKVSAWVERQIQRYPGNDFVITSRPLGYRSAPIQGAQILQVRSFTDEQVEKFVRTWYQIEISSSANDNAQDAAVRADAEADDLLNRLRSAPALHDLTVNPLLLTMIVNVHRYLGALPGSRFELYRDIIEVMLWRRHDALGVPVIPRGNRKEVILRDIAFRMMKQHVVELSFEDITRIIKKRLPRVSREVSAEEFLRSAESSGLLVELESGTYAFSHLTFQEYLAACYIRESREQNLPILLNAVSGSWWREVTLLFVAESDATPIVEACLSSATVQGLSLALDCVEEASELAEELQFRMQDLIYEALQSGADYERRRLVAKVVLLRHLRYRVATSARHLCARPITEGIYQIFIRDSLDNHLPDAPEPGRLHFGDGPMLGMRAGDAMAFVRWANDLMEGDRICALPTLSEIKESSVLASLRASSNQGHDIWLAPDENGTHRLWSMESTSDWIVSPWELHEHVLADLKSSSSVSSALLLIHARALVQLLSIAIEAIDTVDVHSRYEQEDFFGDFPAHSEAQARLTELLELDQISDSRFRDSTHFDVLWDLNRQLISASLTNLSPIVHSLEGLKHVAGGQKQEDTLAKVLLLDQALEKYTDINPATEASRAMGIAFDLVTRRDRDLVWSRGSASSPVEVLVRELYSAINPVVEATGTAISQSLTMESLTAALTGGVSSQQFRSELYEKITNILVPDEPLSIIFPDQLEGAIESGCRALCDALDQSVDIPTSQWVRGVCQHLLEVAPPAILRKEPFTSKAALAVRIASLCLALEADQINAPSAGETFRGIAAGITYLQSRMDGSIPANEIIVLAVE